MASILMIYSWSWAPYTMWSWEKKRCFRFISLPLAIRRLDRPPTGIALRRPKIRWRRLAIIRKIPRTSSADVVTLGFTYGIARIEGSGFHGREPDENRWNIDQGAIDSWSTRLTIQPGKNWSGQYSYARIKSPEQLFPDETQERMTASIMYNRPLRDGNWATTILWGRTRSLEDNSVSNAYLLESTVRFRKRNYAWTRIENLDRWNELLLGENPLPPNFRETTIGRVQAYTFGYDHDFNFIPHVASALGAQITAYRVADVLKPIYGSDPMGVVIFVRFRPYLRKQPVKFWKATSFLL